MAVVTGGASGIGRALCEELARLGSMVIVADLDADGARQVSAGIVASGGHACAARVDVACAEEVQSLVADTVSEHGRLDYVFNNAGIAVGGELRDLELDHWRRIVDVNLMGVVYGTTAAYVQMLKQGSGHIVNTASIAGLIGFPGALPYSTTKSGVIGMSLSLRAEAADLGVKVSVVCPGFVRTNIYEASTLVNASKDEFIAQIPLNMMPADRAARAIVRGVSRNKAVIVFPFHARMFWWLHRFAPWTINSLHRQAVRRFRTIRKPPSLSR
ncbi:MAG TPA: SDR family oxidoreductase [Blastocatellia bacterium]|nr:SDR family oxidoreductase [Blastocatellia bacterium]